jgi:hypothetical protein
MQSVFVLLISRDFARIAVVLVCLAAFPLGRLHCTACCCGFPLCLLPLPGLHFVLSPIPRLRLLAPHPCSICHLESFCVTRVFRPLLTAPLSSTSLCPTPWAAFARRSTHKQNGMLVVKLSW